MSENTKAIIKTSKGDITVEFWTDVAPNTVANFIKLAGEGFYEGTRFHRIIKGFMIQGGCPHTKDLKSENLWGTGGPGHTVNAEFNSRTHEKGVFSMARSQDPNSAGSQFFLCNGDAKFLDNQYTAFGKLCDGEDILDAISDIPVTNKGGENSFPTELVTIDSIELVDV
ncbi:peptidylprolyl isomerase [Verrucomicrobia bacterium]|nr:peptidylprolyl isomerase [Verrucomicrobiota bacterium]